jgi:D-serine deaminase-like pyridoxal phosphate-dependent protein
MRRIREDALHRRVRQLRGNCTIRFREIQRDINLARFDRAQDRRDRICTLMRHDRNRLETVAEFGKQTVGDPVRVAVEIGISPRHRAGFHRPFHRE